MAKFVSKSANLHIVLKPGIPAQPITGTPAQPTLSVRFQDGVVDINDAELVEKMRNHPGFSRDYIEAVDETHDPFASYRKESEPEHVLTELKYGTPVKKESSGNQAVSPELKRMISEQAAQMAKQMAPQMAKQLLQEMMAQQQQEKENTPAEDEVEAGEEVSVDMVDEVSKEESAPKDTKAPSSKKKK